MFILMVTAFYPSFSLIVSASSNVNSENESEIGL